MALPFQRPVAGTAPGHVKGIVRVPRWVPSPGMPRGQATGPVVPGWLVPARAGVGSAYAAAKRKP